MRAAGANMSHMAGLFGSLLQQPPGGDDDVPPPIAAAMAPPRVTARIKSQIAALPLCGETTRRSRRTWYVHLDVDTTHDGDMLTCIVREVRKEHGSNGRILGDGDGLGMALAMCATFDPSGSTLSRPPLLLGTIVKACLEPGNTLGGASGLLQQMEASPRLASVSQRLRYTTIPGRPARVLFQNRGELEMLSDDLADMNIHDLDIAESNLVQSVELFSGATNSVDMTDDDAELLQRGDPQLASQVYGRQLMAETQAMYEPYVSEERVSLRGWDPPSDPGALPREWYAKPPDDVNNWRPTQLLGWRTNLERAVLRADVDKIKSITAKRDAGDVREFVELRMLLTKMAQKGMVVSCRALLDYCGASVEGAQAPDAEPWWLPVQDESGNCDSLTPLHKAARNGQAEVIKLLLDRGADVNAIDKARIRGSPLHHAVSMGHLDCVRILCDHGADLTYVGLGGEALDISEMVAGTDEMHRRVQDKVQEILREVDGRCSYCRAGDPTKTCPCGKEKYCDTDCQRGRWKKHKKFHKIIMEAK